MNLTLNEILSKKLGKTVVSADYTSSNLHGGTLGEVKLLSGSAKTSDGTDEPFSLVWKTQKKWERPGDPDSWRREYDLYCSGMGNIFAENFRIPECYHAELSDDKMQLWIEYINGVSGENLSINMLETAAEALGNFQGRLFNHPELIKNTACLQDTEFMERENSQWHSSPYTYNYLCSEECCLPGHLKKWVRENPWNNKKSLEYNYLRSADFNIPKHLKQMLIGIDDNRDDIFRKIKILPVVFCHRDFWIENIFYMDGKIAVIDWDCAGWGYLGEDMASLIADDTETDNLHKYYRKLIPAYFKGLSKYMDIPLAANKLIWEMIILKFGYRIVQNYMFTSSDDTKNECIDRLKKIYEMRDMELEYR